MTTIVVRDGVMAADSRSTTESEKGGSRVFRCEKMYRRNGAIIGLAGESAPGLVFLDWYGSGREPPASLLESEADFTAIVLNAHGVFEYDKWCRGERVVDKFYAIGSGAKAALGALHMGASAAQACRIACRIDPYSAPPIRTMKL